jgi:NTE family protein
MNEAQTRTRKKKIGLALGGGAARGLAHVGVLDVLKEEGIPIDLIAGTSAGAIIGAAYARNQDTDRMIREAMGANWKKMAPLIDPSLLTSGFVKGKKILSLISSFVGGDDISFSDLKIPFACVATDIDTGEEVVINSGPVADALRASISLPGIFTVVKRGDRYLVDGGLTTPVPVDVVRQMGADFIIAVSVNPEVAGRVGKAYQHRIEEHKAPNILQVMMQSFYITAYSLAQHTLEHADSVIEPDVSHFSVTDFNKAKELIAHGRVAAQKAIPEIKRKLGQL